MRFQVPQFIEVDDKIFGPLTLKQFIYLVGGGGLSFLIYVLLDSLLLSALPILLIMAISAAFAFYKVNNKPFVNVLEAAFKYYFGNKLFIWKKGRSKASGVSENQNNEAGDYASLIVPKISDSRLKDLTWSLDIRETKVPEIPRNIRNNQ